MQLGYKKCCQTMEFCRDVSNQKAYLAYIQITNKGNGKFEVIVDNSNMLHKTFDLVAKVDGYEAKTRQTVQVMPFF